MPWALAPGYIAAQLLGAVLGTWLAHAMFDLGVLQVSTHLRSGAGNGWPKSSTFGLVLVVLRGRAAPRPPWPSRGSVAYWFTASTSFANPAAAFGRMFSDSFAGIAPSSVPAFVLAELAGAALAVFVSGALGTPRHAAPLLEPSNA